MKTWREAVIDGIRRITKQKRSYIFSRQELIANELNNITQEANAQGETPSQTLSRVLQELRDEQLVEFVDNQGNYIFLFDKIKIVNEDLPENIIDLAIKSGKLDFTDVDTRETSYQTRQRVGQQRLRHLTLMNYQHRCALCDVSDDNLLVAAHIARWADSKEGRGDLGNIICLCKWHDPLLEHGLIAFADNYDILKKSTHYQMVEAIYQRTGFYRQPIEKPLVPKYLALHRKRTGFPQ